MDVVSHRIHFVKCWLSSIKTLTEPFYFHKLSRCIYRTILCSLYGVVGELQSQQVGLVGYSQLFARTGSFMTRHIRVSADEKE